MTKKAFKNPFFLLVAVVLTCVGALALGGSHFQFSEKKSSPCLTANSDSLFITKYDKKIIESPELSFVQGNSLSGVSSPQVFSSKVLGVLTTKEEVSTGKEIFEYTVEEGDSLGSIAAKFDISLNTILWANDLSSRSVIRTGQKLIILPTTGAIHHVKNGDTISEIAQRYEGKTKDIIEFNDLSGEGDIYVGDILIVPDGVKPPKAIVSSGSDSVPLASSYFIIPVSSPYRVTQGLHFYNAIDFAHNSGESCGKPVFAAAGGTVQKVEFGYNQGMGNYVRVIHPNGLITHYGHLQKTLVSSGQKVSQGEMIGLIGYSGKTIPAGPSGCHLHFALYSSQGLPPTNPFISLFK